MKALVESLSTPPSRAGTDASGGKKPWLWMLFSLLQMGASSSRTTSLKCILKTGQVQSPEFKKTHLIFFFVTEWPQYPLEDRKLWPGEGSQLLLFYN